MKAIKTIVTCYLAFLTFNNISAQVTINADKTSGCSPMGVNFTVSTSIAGTLTYEWNFGNGNTSNLKEPYATFNDPGSYNVTLTVKSNGTAAGTAQKAIVVFRNPVANFTASSNAKGCVPINITFSDASTKGDANITKWNWDFRNGVLSTEPSFTNAYNTAGKFDVLLEVTDANGCKDYEEKKSYVDVVEEPIAKYIATPPNSCTVPANIQFTNQSTGGGTLTYLWDFGGGVTSTEINPIKTYTAFGTYPVKFKVTSSYGCFSDLDATSIVIGEVKAQGTLKQGTKNIINNSIVCAGDMDYANLSAGSPNCLWDFGDGTLSYSQSGQHNYQNAGNYKIKLIAAPGDACADTAFWNVTVEKATASFNFTPDNSCHASNTVSFVNQSSANSISYKWTFHDGSVQTSKDVIKTYTQPKDKDQYVVHEAFSYPVKLTVTSTNGCKDSLEKVFNVQQPTALFSVSASQGCAPLVVNFTDISSSSDPINERNWIFGDGANQKLLSNTTSHTYNTPGTYEATMIATTNAGCKDTSYIVQIKVGNTLTPNFSINNSTVCSSQKIEFTNLSPVQVQRWHYSIGGKNIPACPGIPSPSVYMQTDTGKLNTKLVVDYNGCFSEVEKPEAVKNDGPAGSFSYNSDCSLTRAVVFKGVSKKATSFKWEFGDTEINTANLQLTHFYSAEGDYTVKFITFTGACSDTVIRIVKVRDRQPKFTMKTEVCAGDVVYFNSKLSHAMFTACTEKYLWNFGDNTQPIRTHKDSVSHSFVNGGNFQVKLYAFYEDGCTDSLTKSIRVYKPVPGFTVNRSEGCAPLPVTFTDTSTPDVHPINFWNWDFADDNTVSYTTKIASLDNTFFSPGEFNVRLSVTDDFGCKATFEKKISTAVPMATFSALSPTQICAGTEVSFLMDYPDPDSAIWSLGDGRIVKSVEKPVKFLFNDPGDFSVSLKLYKYGCSSDEFTINDPVMVEKADARFSASDTIYNCYPRLIKLAHLTGANNVVSGKWFYGHNNNESPGYMDSTSYNYTEPGFYRAKLEIRTVFGCTDTFSRVLKITGPTGQFAVTPKEACQGDEITYTLSDTANIHSFIWDLGDGNSSKNNPVKHRYSSVGNKTARLILYGDQGKCIPPAVEETIHIYEVTAGINVADTSVCEGTTITFKNSSVGANIFNWNFGDGATSTVQEPNHLFPPGTYKVSLMTSGLNGCKDTTDQYIVVSNYPTLTISNDTTICDSIGLASLKAYSNRDIRWEPSTYLTAANVPNPIARARESIKYIAFATDQASGCYRKDSVVVTVQKKPKLLIEKDASSFVAGRPIQIRVIAEDGAIYKWSPGDFLSCTTCPDPVSTARLSTSYQLQVKDKNNCFSVDTIVHFNITEGEKAFDLPSAFTPSGPEPNNIFKVQGYNVKQLLEFKIYNRWGNVVFSSTDLSKGWDGTYQGKAQPVDTYVYIIRVETFDGRVETKKGTLLLLR